MSGSESQAQPGWAWGSSPQSQGLGGGQVGTPGSGRQAGSSHQAPGLCRAGANGPVSLPGSAVHQVHPCGGGAVNGRRVACPYPGIPQSFSKYPLTHCPMDPSSPLWGQENRVRVLVPWCFWLRAVDPCKNTHPPGDGPDTSIFLLEPLPLGPWPPLPVRGHPTLGFQT